MRVCFVMHLRPDRVDDYLRAHENVWPEMLDALRAAGWSNYSLHLDRAAAMVVGYVEALDFEKSTSELARTAVNAQWQQSMSEYFLEGPPDRGLEVLEEYFHLP